MLLGGVSKTRDGNTRLQPFEGRHQALHQHVVRELCVATIMQNAHHAFERHEGRIGSQIRLTGPDCLDQLSRVLFDLDVCRVVHALERLGVAQQLILIRLDGLEGCREPPLLNRAVESKVAFVRLDESTALVEQRPVEARHVPAADPSIEQLVLAVWVVYRSGVRRWQHARNVQM